MVRNLLAHGGDGGDVEMRVHSLGWEDPLEEGMANHSSTLAWRTPWTGSWSAKVHRVAKN